MIVDRARIGSTFPKLIGVWVETARRDFFRSEDIKHFVVSGWSCQWRRLVPDRKANSVQNCNGRSLRDFVAYPSLSNEVKSW